MRLPDGLGYPITSAGACRSISDAQPAVLLVIPADADKLAVLPVLRHTAAVLPGCYSHVVRA